MILAQLQRQPDRPVTLFWGLRSQRDLYWQDEWAALAAIHPHFTVVTTLSQAGAGGGRERQGG